MARLLRQTANLLVLDEPTNHLDVPTLGALESMLVDCGATVLIVTHDRWLLDRVATTLLVWSAKEQKVTLHAGNFTTYRRLQAETQAQLSAAPQERAKKRVSGRSDEPRAVNTKGLSFAQTREIEGLVSAIEAAEQTVATLTTRLSDPATYARGGPDVAELRSALSDAKAEAERLMARWEELENKRAGC